MIRNNEFLDCFDIRSIDIDQNLLPRSIDRTPNLESRMIHVWLAEYSKFDLYFEVLHTAISTEELKTANRFRKPKDARKFIIRHGCLRLILGYYTDNNPGQIQIVKGVNGKPVIDPLINFSGLSFSLSSTGHYFIIGITKTYGIGIDIEKMDISIPFQEIADYLFTEKEKMLITGSGKNQLSRQFIRIWTIKEAILKATGGSAQMMRGMDVSTAMNGSFANGVYVMRLQNTPCRFFIFEFNCWRGHHCTIAVNIGK